MSIRPFISSTREDMDPDCRPDVIDAVRLTIKEEPLVMETWDVDYEEPVELCRGLVERSTHFIGVFAYRRGWVLETLKKSITEAEFDWAISGGKRMVVFVPNPAAPFAEVLRDRAKGQDPADAEAQESFLKRVRQNGTCQLFKNPSDLCVRVSRRVDSWMRGGLRSEGPQQQPTTPPPQGAQTKKRPTADQIIQLGRKDQSRQVADDLDILLRPNFPQAACFLIYGTAGHGQGKAAARLRQVIESRSQCIQYQVSLGPLWRQNTPGRLVEIIGASIEPGWVPPSLAALRERLLGRLSEANVVLEIGGINRLAGSLPAFVTELWRPLIDGLDASPAHQLIVLATLEQTTLPDWEQYLQPALDEAAVTCDARLLIKLSELKVFTEAELTLWLIKTELAKPDIAEQLAGALMAETGGVPQLLYSKLEDDSTWNY